MRIISQNRDLSIDFDRTPICVNYNHVLALVGDKERVKGNMKRQNVQGKYLTRLTIFIILLIFDLLMQ